MATAVEQGGFPELPRHISQADFIPASKPRDVSDALRADSDVALTSRITDAIGNKLIAASDPASVIAPSDLALDIFQDVSAIIGTADDLDGLKEAVLNSFKDSNCLPQYKGPEDKPFINKQVLSVSFSKFPKDDLLALISKTETFTASEEAIFTAFICDLSDQFETTLRLLEFASDASTSETESGPVSVANYNAIVACLEEEGQSLDRPTNRIADITRQQSSRYNAYKAHIEQIRPRGSRPDLDQGGYEAPVQFSTLQRREKRTADVFDDKALASPALPKPDDHQPALVEASPDRPERRDVRRRLFHQAEAEVAVPSLGLEPENLNLLAPVAELNYSIGNLGQTCAFSAVLTLFASSSLMDTALAQPQIPGSDAELLRIDMIRFLNDYRKGEDADQTKGLADELFTRYSAIMAQSRTADAVVDPNLQEDPATFINNIFGILKTETITRYDEGAQAPYPSGVDPDSVLVRSKTIYRTDQDPTQSFEQSGILTITLTPDEHGDFEAEPINLEDYLFPVSETDDGQLIQTAAIHMPDNLVVMIPRRMVQDGQRVTASNQIIHENGCVVLKGELYRIKSAVRHTAGTDDGAETTGHYTINVDGRVYDSQVANPYTPYNHREYLAQASILTLEKIS